VRLQAQVQMALHLLEVLSASLDLSLQVLNYQHVHFLEQPAAEVEEEIIQEVEDARLLVWLRHSS
jgi:hypothetical protein